MKSTFLALCAASILFFSCANDKSSDKSETTASPQVEMAPAPPLNPTVIQVPPLAPQAPGITTAGLNPAHGQPGHDCAIAVGAPLNSAPSASGTTPTLGGPRVPVASSPPGLAPSLMHPQQQPPAV